MDDEDEMIPDKAGFLAFLAQDAISPLDARALMEHFSITPAREEAFLAFLEERVKSGDAVLIKGGRYAHPSRVGLVVGRLQMHSDGFGFVIPDDPKASDLHVRGRDLFSAMNGDRVVARVETSRGRPSGTIIRILTRANEKLIGIVRMQRKMAVVVPTDERVSHQVMVSRDDLLGAADGMLVQLELTQFPTHDDPPVGRVVHVLGYPGNEDVEAKAIALKHKIRIEFPKEVLKDADKLPKKVRVADIKGRADLRNVGFVTIDGERARDFDDAVQVEDLGTKYLLRVAIADVSHYVRPGAPVDDEAALRGTSTYFPDRVFPMLPERLSNGLCSLIPNEDRLAFVAEMEYSRGGRRQTSRFYTAVIKSKRRLTYTEVARSLDDPDSKEAQELGETVADVTRMWALAQLIRSRRKERGSIDFDLPQPEIILDLSGRPEDIIKSDRNHAHYLIEEFMIAANEAVAEHLEKAKVPAPFRVHEPPSSEKVEEFRRFIHNFGYALKSRGEVKPADFQELVERSESTPESRMINQMMLRTMRKAVYAPVNLGHFGLASTHYLHFTSPIRRYPDLVVHRLLKRLLEEKGPKGKWRAEVKGELEAECPRLSERERASESAEREAVAWKKCQFMADKVGEVYWGFITGVAGFGFFVELEQYFVDGLVHVSSLRDDFYHFSEETQSLIGERTRRRFRIGDRIRVTLERVNVEKRQVDFTLVEEEAPAAKPQAQPQRQAQGQAPKAGQPAKSGQKRRRRRK